MGTDWAGKRVRLLKPAQASNGLRLRPGAVLSVLRLSPVNRLTLGNAGKLVVRDVPVSHVEEAVARVVNRRHEPYDVYIGRPSKWGNPFGHRPGRGVVWLVDSADDAITAYREWVRQIARLLLALPELQEKRLGCYCKPRACHGDVLLELLEESLSGRLAIPRHCRVCKCSERNACHHAELGACWWVAEDLCSHCERRLVKKGGSACNG